VSDDPDRLSTTAGPSPLERACDALVDDDQGDGDLPGEVVKAVPGNAARQVVALALQKAGDLVVDARTVLA
jgi:hypothetical protein